MILYSIRRISDGKFFIHTNGRGEPMWSTSPVYWKTSIAVWQNLKRLCSDFYQDYYSERWPNFWHKNWKNFNIDLLDQYEVIETNVTVLGEKQTPARCFVIPQDIEELDVRIKA